MTIRAGNQELSDRSPLRVPPCDPDFRPIIGLYRNVVGDLPDGGGVPVRVGLERENGQRSVFETRIPESASCGEDCRFLVERMIKFLLWSRGGWKIHFHGPRGIGERIRSHYRDGGSRSFDVRLMEKIYERPFDVVLAEAGDFPGEHETPSRLGGHLEGCRIGFDLGASDMKVAAVYDGKVLFSEEIPWIPGEQADPEYHFGYVQEALKRAASRLPRVDAIGGSSAGVFINGQVRGSSLFRSVPEDLFEPEVKNLFLRIRDEWGVPFEILNDGVVTALAGRMSLDETAVLGIAMGSSQAAGFLNASGRIPGWLDELAFVPVDVAPEAAVDEWSGDRGVGATYFSQQGVDRLARAAGFSFPGGMRLPERLEQVQDFAAKGDEKAADVFESIGIYLAYTIPWYEIFYDFRNLLVLGRVMSGVGGSLIMKTAGAVLREAFPDSASRVKLHLLDETSRRVGQAVAAASLPDLGPDVVGEGISA